MIKTDKIKIVIPLRELEADSINKTHPDWKTHYIPSETGFNLQSLSFGNPNETKSKHYPSISPQSKYKGINFLKVDYLHPSGPQVIIIVTGKILDNPAQLISTDTINEVWGKINATGMLYGYAPHILPHCQLISIDVTCDGVMEENPDEYTDIVRRYYTGKNWIQPKDYNPNIQLQNKSKSKKYQRTVTGYNKTRETDNPCFAPNTLRWELRLNSFEMIRKYLDLPPGPIMLMQALESAANPIAQAFDELMKDITLTPAVQYMKTPAATPITPAAREALFWAQELTFDEKPYFALLQKISFNLAPLRSELRGNKNAARKLKPYVDIFAKWQGFTSNSCNDATLLNEMLEKIKNNNLKKLIKETIYQYAENE